MVGSVVLPEPVDLVASPVVCVEEEVEDDRVQEQLDRDPFAERNRSCTSI